MPYNAHDRDGAISFRDHDQDDSPDHVVLECEQCGAEVCDTKACRCWLAKPAPVEMVIVCCECVREAA